MAGVPVGEIAGVTLKNGRAVVTMSIKAKYEPDIHKNATILVRPKTGLNDMLLQLDPGTKSAGKAPNGYTLPVSQTLPTVNTDEILASLDTGTRDYLKLLIGGAGEGLRGNAEELSSTLRRFDPLTRDINTISKLLAQRQTYVKRNVTNLNKIATALAGNDTELTAWVTSANGVFADFAAQDKNLRAALGELPTALRATNDAVVSADKLGRTLGPTAASLEPFAQNLAPASIATQDFFKATTPVLEKQLRPFSKAVQPTVADLRPAAASLAKANPSLTGSLSGLNYVFNTLAYEPKGAPDSYLFFLGWLNHIGVMSFTNQDAMGPVRRGVFLTNCTNSTVLAQIQLDNTPLGTLTNLVNAPSVLEACKDDPAALEQYYVTHPGTRPGSTTTPTTATATPPAARSAAPRTTGGTTKTASAPGGTATTVSPVPVTTTTPALSDTPQSGEGAR